MAHAAANETAAEARFSRLEEALRRLISTKARRPTAAGPTRFCHRCGSTQHLVRHCHHPPLGANPTRSRASPALLHGGHWLLDSGTTHHMSSGGKRGATAFRHYHAFDEPVMVQFGMREAMAPAIGLGELVGLGHAGSEVLDGVLHVPDLVVSLFSVQAALARGVAVHFCPATSPDTKEKVDVERGGSVVFSAREHGGMYCLGAQACAASAMAMPGEPELAVYWHRRLGHLGYDTLAKLSRAGMLEGCSLAPASFVQARKAQVCEPCMIGKMRRTSHPSRPSQKVQVLHRVHMNLCELAPGCYFSTMIDEATRFARVGILHCESDTAAKVRTQVVWCETQTGKRVQRVRHDRGGEYMSGQLQTFFAERGIQQEPTAGYTPEAIGLAERHNLTLRDIALPMLKDSGDPQRGLPPLDSQYAGAAVIYANNLHNATPAPSALVGRTPHEGFLHRTVGLSAFRRFGCRVWMHSPGHRQKLAPRALPGRFLGFERPFGSSVVLALLDSGHVTQSQTVEFDDEPRVLAPVLLPKEPVSVDAADQGEDNNDSNDEIDLRTAQLPSSLPPKPMAAAQPLVPSAAAMLPGELTSRPVAIQPQTWPGRSGRSTQTKQPCYCAHPAICQKQTVEKTGERQRKRGPRWLQRKRSAVRRRQKQRESQVQSLPQSHAPPLFPEVRMQTGHRTRKRKRAASRHPRQQREQRPVSACAAWRNAIGLADGAAQLDDVRAGMQHLALTCASDEPRSASEAFQRSDAEEWHSAEKAEIALCLEHGTWHRCDLPEGRKPLTSHFVYAQMRDGRYKARLVAGGHKQQQGVDLDVTFAPVCSYRSIHMMLAVAAREGLELRQFDMKTAFLNGYLTKRGVHPPATWVEIPGWSWLCVTPGPCPPWFATGVEGLE
jgi:hypothetical protein